MSFETMVKYAQDVKYVEMFNITTLKVLLPEIIGRRSYRIL